MNTHLFLKTTILLSCLLFPSIIKAGEGIEVGLRYEPLRSWYLNREVEMVYNYQNTSGYAYGISLDIRRKKNISFESGLLYFRQGQKLTKAHEYNYSGYDTTTLDVNFDLYYIKVPLLLKISSDKEKKVFFSFCAGPQLAFLSSAKLIVIDLENSPYNFNQETDFSSTFNGLVVEIAAGAGINVRLLNNINASAILRFDQSLGNVDKQQAVLGQSFSGSRNRTLGIMLGLTYLFSNR